jgi:hypothetical protein
VLLCMAAVGSVMALSLLSGCHDLCGDGESRGGQGRWRQQTHDATILLHSLSSPHPSKGTPMPRLAPCSLRPPHFQPTSAPLRVCTPVSLPSGASRRPSSTVIALLQVARIAGSNWIRVVRAGDS